MGEPPASIRGKTLHMVRAGTPVPVGERLGEGAQGVVHAASVGGAPCAVKWFRAVPKPVELRRSLTALIDRGRPHPSFIWPIDLVESSEVPGFGYVMPRLEPGFESFAQLLRRPEQPPFRTMITIGRQLVGAFEALHAAGLCYRDINFGNLWVNPRDTRVAILDNDNVGIDDGDVFVWGTLRFMAPEVVRRETYPSGLTDLHSLAVFLFYLFVHGHPLEGLRTETSYSWASSGESESEIAVRTFGREPLFVFDPADSANAPPPGDPMLTWWHLYPGFFRELFERAFTEGLSSPVAGRVTEGLWRRALLRLADCVSACACSASVLYDPGNPGLRCWNCGQVPPRPPRLELPGSEVVLAEGAVVTSQHLYRDRRYDAVIAVVEPHPARSGQVVLRNVGPTAWSAEPYGERPVIVPPTRRLGVRPMSIDFGAVAGRITVS